MQTTPALRTDPRRTTTFSDGSMLPNQGVGAAAVNPTSGAVSKFKLGKADEHTVYEAEVLALELAATQTLQHLENRSTSFWFLVDNQPAILALSQRLRPTTGLRLRRAAQKVLHDLLRLHPYTSIRLVWCPAHVGIDGNEEADTAAKTATELTCPTPRLPISLASARLKIKTSLKHTRQLTPSPQIVNRLRKTYNPTEVRSALASLARPEAAAIVQLRANHSPHNTFLHRINATDSPNCESCDQPETTEHYLLVCKRYRGARQQFIKALLKLKILRTTLAVLTNPKAFKPLADFIRHTGRFRRATSSRQP
ncbi:hypothetical protein CROQUDRAFT_193597 [Cronartium quercuum f. sp. fusiforme G11]|uniref:RNase H type-1 domain-containing protein n=1 Tax=Cronartium quercuum f. sp. fusiforme G11 TaxID=708437 RepID=A0A9P6T8L6_9BASI|nr:hypothetical protein CROQUDRAFT_193597 [Cronartium quercuum f. sp. fusiforme G11]